jgi:uncharacterized membrane protein YeiH
MSFERADGTDGENAAPEPKRWSKRKPEDEVVRNHYAEFVLVRRWRLPTIVLMYADAVGLAVFTVIGFQKGFHATNVYSIAIVMGVTTGVVGGIIRDVLSGEIPLILRREIYASASLCGAALLALLSYLQLPSPFTVSAAVLTTLVIRLAALHGNMALPLFRLEEGGEEATRSEPENRGDA